MAGAGAFLFGPAPTPSQQYLKYLVFLRDLSMTISMTTTMTKSMTISMTMTMSDYDYDDYDYDYDQCCGSGSARIRNFCLDPDPAKSERAYQYKLNC